MRLWNIWLCAWVKLNSVWLCEWTKLWTSDCARDYALWFKVTWHVPKFSFFSSTFASNELSKVCIPQTLNPPQNIFLNPRWLYFICPFRLKSISRMIIKTSMNLFFLPPSTNAGQLEQNADLNRMFYWWCLAPFNNDGCGYLPQYSTLRL